ncbi:MAG: phosphate acyltransferase PlsX [Nevskia sp.]|nr:phosphate acyltransferase PlsX [Nevskia sp.]
MSELSAPAAAAATRPITLAIDAMSGDHGLEVAVDGALRVLAEIPTLKLILVGDEAALRRSLRGHRHLDNPRLELQPASEVVAMDESPSKALRYKKDSSMRVAINLVKEKRAQAAVSAGNTGALMGIARFVLKTLPGIDRPAIMSPLPAIGGVTHVLDLGANADCTAEQLVQFAVMGSAVVTALHGVERPRVALLNIGEEEIKGNETIKAASALLSSSPLNYTGYIEGDGIFLHPVDVVVCDGFVGNVALKAGEGVAKLVAHFMREEFTRTLPAKLVALIARSVLRALAKRMDPRLYNGASFLGLQGTVIKSHGGADALAFANAIKVAVREVEQDVPARISRLLGSAIIPPPVATVAAK